jgi:hypothetical protein
MSDSRVQSPQLSSVRLIVPLSASYCVAFTYAELCVHETGA